MEFKTLEDLQEYNRKARESIFGKVRIQQEKALDIDGLSYFERITAISQPHKVFKLDWSSYQSIDYANTFLPKTNGYKGKGVWMYDGAELFKGLIKTEQKLYKFDNSKYLISLINYTYPKGVSASKNIHRVRVTKNEVCTFIEIDKNNDIKIQFKFGSRFKNYIKEHSNIKNVNRLEEKIYKTNSSDFQTFFKSKLVHRDMMNFILHTINLNELVKKYTITTAYFAVKDKEKENYTKIDSIKLEQELYIIVKGTDIKNKKVLVNILDKDNILNIVKADDDRKFVPVLVNKKQVFGIKGEFDKKDSSDKTGKTYFTAIKIKLRAEKDDDLKKMYENLDKSKSDKAYLYLLIDIHTANTDIKKGEVTYEGKNKDDDNSVANYWLDEKDKYLAVSFCNCGYQYIKKFKCVKFNSLYGPVFWGTKRLAQFNDWSSLIKNKKITSEEKDILIGMSENEGKLDTVHSYDKQYNSTNLMILTAGAMQKTVDGTGKGEFVTQVEEFMKDFPKKYKVLFEDCGWTVENKKMYYKNPKNKNSKKITGQELAKKIRAGFTKDTYKKYLRCLILEPIVKAIIDQDFQNKQVADFITRLNDVVLEIKPTGHTDYKLKNFLKSKLGKATALDHHINRPNFVKTDFGKALDNFFSKKDKETEKENKKIEKENEAITDPKLKKKKKEKISRDPKDWGDKHSEYESDILEYYGKNRRGTDMENRFKKLKNKF